MDRACGGTLRASLLGIERLGNPIDLIFGAPPRSITPHEFFAFQRDWNTLNEEFGFRLSGVLNLIDEDHKHEPGAPYECYVEGRVTAGDSIGRPPAALGFWNLNWANKVVIQPDLRRQPIRFPLPLAGGVAQPLIDSMLAWINQGLSEAINFLAVELAARLSAGGFGPPDFPHFVATAT